MDLVYDAAAAFAAYMDSGPSLLGLIVWIPLAAIPVTLLHELGHALAARDRLGTTVHIRVGNAVKLAELRLGAVSASINLAGDPTRAGGSATFDARGATARDIAWIAVAGPIVSAASLGVTLVLYVNAAAAGPLHDFLWAAVGAGVAGVLNLIPLRFQERRGGPFFATDGRLALDAWRVLRALA